jgi:antitoxin component of MazEF toxin-antitoxin module
LASASLFQFGCYSLYEDKKIVENNSYRGYNVTIMASITTKLVKDGNSVAVRIPKTALAMSGLKDEVQMEVSQGQIVLTSAKSARAGWRQQIEYVLATNPDALAPDSELAAWDATVGDGLD